MSHKSKAVEIAKNLLTIDRGAIEELLVRAFGDGVAAHSSDLQAVAQREFGDAFQLAEAELSAEFGPAVRTANEDAAVVPICGVFRLAIWELAGRKLYLVAAHEDRELPYLLMLGTA